MDQPLIDVYHTPVFVASADIVQCSSVSWV